MISCQDKYTDSQLRILIRNETDSLMTVKLYPKSKYVRFGKYTFSDMHSRYKDTTFVADSRLGSELYVTDDISIEPHLLAVKIFDSINISLSSGKTLMRFSPQRVINYSYNLFSDKSVWVFEKNKFEVVKMWRNNFIESDDYIFIISSRN
jgi:hypothetical protein